MSTTWSAINTELSTLLDDLADTPEEYQYSTDLRIGAWNRAQQRFAVGHTAPLIRYPLEVEDTDDGVIADLPDDFIQLHSVKADKWQDDPHVLIPGQVTIRKVWLKPNRMIPGESEDQSGYMLLPTQIFFPSNTRKVSSVVMWYYGFYPDVTDDETDIVIPHWAEWPLINLAISYILIPSEIGMANLRQFQSKMEAGTPLDNPARAQAEYHARLYSDYLKAFPEQVRTQFYSER